MGEDALIIVADCTGHGVPGAFMSLIAINLLDSVVLQKGVTSPAQILRDLHDLVRFTLKQEDTDNQSGMDMGIVKLSLRGDNVLHFAGAKRPLNYIDSSDLVGVKTIAGSRKSIGGTQNDAKDFEEVSLTLPTDSLFYVSSDGLADQNNPKRKRLKEEPILEVLWANHAAPLEVQKNELVKLLDAHTEGTEQRDDILFLGVKI